MNVKRLIIFILTILCSVYHGLAQTGANTIGSLGHKFFIDKDLQAVTGNNYNITGSGECISTYDGSMLFYVESGVLYDPNFNVVGSNTSKAFSYSRVVQLDDSNFIMIGVDRSNRNKGFISINYSLPLIQ